MARRQEGEELKEEVEEEARLLWSSYNSLGRARVAEGDGEGKVAEEKEEEEQHKMLEE